MGGGILQYEPRHAADAYGFYEDHQVTGISEELADARGQLAPFLRDTLVGLNYAYYEPPAA